MCVWEIYTLHSACAWVREIAGDLESEGRDVCMPERQSDRDLCWVRTLQERGVLMCSCVGVWGRERLLCVCVGWATRGGWLQIKSEVSIFEGL